jgi:hypothetical protein
VPWWLLVKSRLWRLKFSQRVRESTGPCQRKFPYEFIKGVGLQGKRSCNNQSAMVAQVSLSGARVGTADLAAATSGATRPICPQAKRLPDTALGKPLQPTPPALAT